MAFVVNDRVKETSTTTGTGTLSLAGAVSGFQTFVAGIGNSNVTYYAIVNDSGTEFEIGIGTVTDASPDTLSRTTILESSNSDSAVNFSSGTKTVFCTLPASKAVFEDADGHVSVPHDLFVAGGLIDLKNDGGAVSQIKFYCESSNAHAQTLIGAPHSEAASNTLTLPSSGGSSKLLSATSTATVTNKSIDSDNNTITNIVNADIKSSAAIADSKLDTISTAGKVALTALEIDGGTDIGANLADADLFIVDDGAGGTNRKLAASRIATYVGASAGAFAIANLDIAGGTDIGADLVDADEIIVDDGGRGTNRRSDLERVKKYIFSAVSGDATASDAGALTIANDTIESGMLNDNVISGQTALTSGLATTDELLISDGGTIKKMDVSVITEVTDDSATALAIALG